MTAGPMVDPALFHSLSSLRFPISGFRRPPHAEHDSGCGAGAVHGDGFINFVEREGVGDEAIEGHFAGLDEVDEAGDFDIRRNAAAVGAFEDFFEMERERVDGDFFSGAGDSNEDGAAVGMGEVVGEFDDAGIASSVDHDIGSGFSDDGADFFGKGRALGGGVDGVGEAPAGGHLKFRIVDIYTDNGVRADHAGGLGDVEANSTDSEDDKALADFELCIVIDDTDSRGDGATEERGSAKVEAGWDNGETVLGNDGFVVEGGDPPGVDDFVSPTVFGRLGLKAARRAPVENDMVAGLDAGDALPYPLDDAGALMAEEVRKEFVGAFGSLDLIDLRAADSAVMNADMDLTEGQLLRHLEFGDFERGVGLNEDGGFH